MCCSVLQCVAASYCRDMTVLDLRYLCVADVLQCVAVCCSQLLPRHDGFRSEVRVCCRCVAYLLHFVAASYCRNMTVLNLRYLCVADVLQMCCRCVADVLQCDAVCYSVLHCGAVCCRCVAGCCSVTQMCCSVVQCGAVCYSVLQCCNVLYRDAVCCSVLQ